VLEVIDSARTVTGREIPIDMQGRRAGDPSHLVADAAKARAVLGWRPQHEDLADIIGSAWEWHSRPSYAAVKV
jgi:UDP-glucose 4-epimerase